MAALPLLCPAAGPCDLQKCVNPLFEEAEMSRETDQRPAGPQVVQAPGTHDWVRKALLTAVSCPRFSTSSPRMWSRRPRAGFDLPGDVHRDSLRWRWSGRARLAGLCSSSAPGAVRAVAWQASRSAPFGESGTFRCSFSSRITTMRDIVPVKLPLRSLSLPAILWSVCRCF